MNNIRSRHQTAPTQAHVKIVEDFLLIDGHTSKQEQAYKRKVIGKETGEGSSHNVYLWGSKFTDTTTAYMNDEGADALKAKILIFLQDTRKLMSFDVAYPTPIYTYLYEYKSLDDPVHYNSRAFSTGRRQHMLAKVTTDRTGVALLNPEGNNNHSSLLLLLDNIV